MKPSAVIESVSTSVLTFTITTYQTTETAPITSVDTLGVRKRLWTLPKTAGNALLHAIDSEVRAVGRIVVCVEAAAEVRTAMIRILSSGVPKTLPPRKL